MRSNGIDSSSTVDFTGHDRIVSGPVVDISHTGHDTFGYISTGQDDASLVINLDDVAVLDPSLFGLRRMQPERFIEVAVRSFYLTGYYFVEPVNIIKLGMYSPSAVVGYYEERIFLSPWMQQAFLVGLAVGVLTNTALFYLLCVLSVFAQSY